MRAQTPLTPTVDGTCNANEYTGGNLGAESSRTGYITWNESTLFVCVGGTGLVNASTNMYVVFDTDPVLDNDPRGGNGFTSQATGTGDSGGATYPFSANLVYYVYGTGGADGNATSSGRGLRYVSTGPNGGNASNAGFGSGVQVWRGDSGTEFSVTFADLGVSSASDVRVLFYYANNFGGGSNYANWPTSNNNGTNPTLNDFFGYTLGSNISPAEDQYFSYREGGTSSYTIGNRPFGSIFFFPSSAATYSAFQTGTTIGRYLVVGNNATVRLAGRESALTIGRDLTVRTGGTVNGAENGLGTSGAISVSGGITVAGGVLRGFQGGVSASSLTISGGQVDVNSANYTVSGATTVSGGTLAMVDYSNVYGSLFTGTLTVTSGTFQGSATGGGTPLGAAGTITSTGTVAVSGGTADLRRSALTAPSVTLSGTGALTTGTGNVAVSGTFMQSAGTLNFGTGATSAQNLVVSNGTATLEAGDGVVTLTGDLNASAGTFAVAQADRLVLASSVGSVATVSSDAGISGDYTSQRTFTATNGWRTVGVPFDNQTVASLNGEVHLQGFSDLRPGPTNVMLYSYNPANATNVGNGSEAFVPVPATTSALTAGDGYLMYVFVTRNPSTGVAEAAATRTWAVTGRETGSATLTKTLPDSDPAIPSSAFHLVANPYAGDLDWDAILTASTNLSTTYQVVNPASGQFVSYTQGSGTYAGRYIAPYTGFFVESDADATPTSITFAKSQKSNANVPAVVGKNAAVVALFDVSVRGAELASSPVRLAFANDARTDADRWDARLLPALTQQYAQLALVSGERSLIVEGRAFPSGSESYTLRFATTRAGRYTIEASDFNNVPDAWSIRLSDRATGQTVDLRSTPYTFDTDVAASERFSLVVSPTATSAERPVATTLVVSPVFPNPARTGAQLRLTSPVAGKAHVDLFDVLGRRVARRAVDGLVPGAERTLTVDVIDLAAGSYVVRITTPDGQTATRRLTVVR